MNNFNPTNQSDAIKRIWTHFKGLGITDSNFGQSKPDGEITIRTDTDTVYITELKRTGVYRVTLRSAGTTQREQRQRAKEYADELVAIAAAERALKPSSGRENDT